MNKGELWPNEDFDASRIVARLEAAGANATDDDAPRTTAVIAEIDSFMVMLCEIIVVRWLSMIYAGAVDIDIFDLWPLAADLHL